MMQRYKYSSEAMFDITRDLIEKVQTSCLVLFILELSEPDVQLVCLGTQVTKVELQTLDMA